MISANKIFSDREIKKLLKILKTEKEQVLSCRDGGLSSSQTRIIRDYFLFTFISYTGLRISEATHLFPEDIFDDYLIVRPELSKNRKIGTVYFGKKTQALVEDLKKVKSTLNTPSLGPEVPPLSRDFMDSTVFSLIPLPSVSESFITLWTIRIDGEGWS